MEIMELFQKLNNESGITIILVTHEADIAAYSRRVIRFLDGRLVSDKSTIDDRKGYEHEVKQ
jgi:putative ABC transport system ATP-binding protein